MKQKPIVRLLPIILTLSLVIACFSLISSLISTVNRKNTKETREQTLATLEQKKQQLQDQLMYVQSPEFIESEAREKLNMAKPGETVILLGKQQQQTGTDLDGLVQKKNWVQWMELFTRQ